MEIGWLILMIFFIIYGLFLGAMVFHLNTYAFSRSAKWMSNLIIVLAVALSFVAILSFSRVPWNEIELEKGFRNSRYNIN